MVKYEKIIADDKYANAPLIGKILRAQREARGIMQKDIAKKVGLRNQNYLSMMEAGRCSVPLNIVQQVIEAYEFDESFLLVVIKALYPECFDMAIKIAGFANASENPDTLAMNVLAEVMERLHIREAA